MNWNRIDDLISTTVLVVDDDEQICRSLEFMLIELGFRCRTATRWSVANEIMEGESVGRVLSDIQMPEVDGFQVLERVRALQAIVGRPIRIVAMSGDLSEALEHQCMLAGFDSFLKKPFSVEQLLASLGLGQDGSGRDHH